MTLPRISTRHHKPKRRYWWAVAALVVVALVAAVVAILDDAAPDTPAPVVPTTAVQAAPPPPASPTPTGPLEAFGAGYYKVGTGPGQVAPGKYRTAGPPDGESSCYWSRVKPSGTVTNGNAEEALTIAISPTDSAFETRCNWIKVG